MEITTTVQEVVLDDCVIINSGANDIRISYNPTGVGATILRAGARESVNKGVYYVYTNSGTSVLSWLTTPYTSVQSQGGGVGAGGGAVTSYNSLTDLPQIDSVTVIGNKTIAEYGVDSMTESEIETAWGRA